MRFEARGIRSPANRGPFAWCQQGVEAEILQHSSILAYVIVTVFAPKPAIAQFLDHRSSLSREVASSFAIQTASKP